ncbi:hypothetical protein TU73_20030 [Pseudomonas libanensis]|uniref:Uncharacterized protein n=2 Tax=Pseudomonas libanensis TaxID=75588 RepID=A0A0R2Y477_9PSED|nr:hypothetical protein TU73_20030 [Pseudomonas libanensis]
MWRMSMDPISMAAGAAGAVPLVAGIVDKGLDAANGAMDLCNKAMDMAGEGSKIGGEEQQPEGQVNF